MNADEEKCILCQKYYVLKADGTCEGPKTLTEEHGCSRKVANNTEDLTTNTSCNDCDSNKVYKYVLKSQVCEVRRFVFSYDQHCVEWSTTKDKCLKCDNNGFYMKEYKKYHVALPTGKSVPVENCILLDDDEKCVKCKPGMTLTSDKTICRKYAQDEVMTVTRSFNYNFDNRDPITETENMVIHCVAYSQIDAERIGCTKCATGYTGIVPSPESVGTKLYAYTKADKNNYGFDDVVNVYSECAGEGNLYLKTAMYLDTVTQYGSCAVGYKVDSDKPGFACLKCREGFIGKLGQATRFANEEAISGNAPTIVDCERRDSLLMTKVHRGFFFNNYKSTGDKLLRSTYMYWDSCSNGKVPLYMLITALNDTGFSYPSGIQTDGEDLDQIYCVPSPEVTTVPGCQIWGLSGDLLAPLDPTFTSSPSANTPLTRCIVCQPGFEASADGVSCVNKLSHCTVQASDWLGGCMTPTTAFAYTKSDPFGISEASESNADNCKVQSSEGNKECWMCEEGFHW
ncbi:MAG: hypothetical protein AAFO91_06185, partial [Bacteroidota bacterium]